MLVFAHVSDLHFNEVLANASPGAIPHQDPHDLKLCLAMPPALDDARVLTGLSQFEPINVVASGDLTLCGGSEEFAIAHVFLRSNATVSRKRPVTSFGLGVEARRLAAVPGNHDHWGGHRGSWSFAKGMPAFTPSFQGQHFRPTPWRKLWTASDQSISLELFGVDSNSGMAGTRFNYQQGGRIAASELVQLEKMLQAPKLDSTVRAFVCHHSLGYKGGLFGASPLDTGSQNDCCDWPTPTESAPFLQDTPTTSAGRRTGREMSTISVQNCGSFARHPPSPRGKGRTASCCTESSPTVAAAGSGQGGTIVGVRSALCERAAGPASAFHSQFLTIPL